METVFEAAYYILHIVILVAFMFLVSKLVDVIKGRKTEKKNKENKEEKK